MTKFAIKYEITEAFFIEVEAETEEDADHLATDQMHRARRGHVTKRLPCASIGDEHPRGRIVSVTIRHIGTEQFDADGRMIGGSYG